MSEGANRKNGIVCPARAGMIRLSELDESILIRLPRTRGDDPALTALSTLTGEFAPHARG